MIIHIEQAKKRGYTIKAEFEDRQVYIHSKYDPINEAINNIKDITECNVDNIFILLGMGLGYNLIELDKLVNENADIIVLEPNREIFNLANQNIEIKEILEKSNIKVILEEDIESFEFELKNIFLKNQYRNIKLYRLNSYENIYKNYFNNIEDIIYIQKKQLKFHIDTANILAEKITKNSIFNIKHLIYRGNDINKLKNKFKGKSAIIVSAGPSLEKNIDKLKKAQNNSIIISGVRTLKPLLEKGIRPHFICNIDPNDIAYELVENHICDIPLITLLNANNKLINKYKGKIIFTNDKYCEDLICKIEKKRYDTLESGASVANYATCIANYLGCNPIIFVGQDLAYTGNKYHSDIASIGKNEINKFDNDLITIKDINNNDILTSSSLYYFLCWFEEFIMNNNDSIYINATEGGANIKGTEIMSLDDAIDTYCKCEININECIDNLISYKSNNQIKEKVEMLNNVYNNLENNKKNIYENMNLSMKLIDYYVLKSDIDIDRVLNKMDELDNSIESCQENNLLTYYLQPSMIDITLNYSEKIKENDRDAVIRISNRNLNLYKTRYEAVSKIQKYLEKLIEVLKNKYY
ncbi:motility associated factor glycosyltransferase family protein [Tepidibacter mesophilus]|uniref:motility associated factor glycosyltransferase family protein n=1 Tax=Tepidibacter mesophilus TaxID=655607 RepID=UPI000C085C35|nr:6-hydroxymethylpterin diphosphokinase MptE-like protein [Tepidibacter mesophilus]